MPASGARRWLTEVRLPMPFEKPEQIVSMEPGVPPSCEISFEDHLRTAGGEEPLESLEVSFASGRFGRGVLIDAPGLTSGGIEDHVAPKLSYSVRNHYEPSRGAVELWIQPRWTSSRMNSDKTFWALESDDGQHNRIRLGCCGANGLAFAYFGNDNYEDAVKVPIDWKAGEWHHVLACWDETMGCRGLYLDGRHAGVCATSRPMPSRVEAFGIGYLPGPQGAFVDWYQAESVIDEFKLYRGAVPADFARAAGMMGNYWTAYHRLRKEYSLDRVARERIEVTLEDLQGLAEPFTKRVAIQARYHPDVVFALPDLSIALGREEDSLGIGFALDSPARLPDMYAVRRGLHRGYLPIVESQWREDALVVDQTAFAYLPEVEETSTGREKQYVAVRMSVTNEDNRPVETKLLVSVGRMHETQIVNYTSFEAPPCRWQSEALGIELRDHALWLGDRLLLTYRGDDGVRSTWHPTLDAEEDELRGFTNCLAFELSLAPGETRSIDLVTAASSRLLPPEDEGSIKKAGFDETLARAVAYWERGLEPGMKLTLPEERLNHIYKAMILSCLNNISRHPERPWDEPYQSCIWQRVWPWEFAAMATPLISIGYHEEIKPSLRFFTERQVGVGAHAENHGPKGDIGSIKGCYVGTSQHDWMCETGAVLRVLGELIHYTRDRAWIEDNKASILAAWNWIQGERRRNYQLDEQGERVRYYGLFPPGAVHDWGGMRYHYTFTDTNLWNGMDAIATAFRQTDQPEADRLREEADEYRDRILEAVRREEFVDPETGLPFVPNTLFYREGQRGGMWWGDGPYCLFAAGLLDARTDERFDNMLAYLERKWGTLMGILGNMDPDPENAPFWYVNSAERAYHMNFLARGELEKALLVLYSTIRYGMSQDCYQTLERIRVDNGNYGPFQPNASGNGRIIEMLRRTVLDEQDDGILWLLRGCPRRWFAAGKGIVVEDAPTRYGHLALRTESDGHLVRVKIDLDSRQSRPEIRLVVRHPERRPPERVEVNGKPATVTDGAVVIEQPPEQVEVVFTFGVQASMTP